MSRQLRTNNHCRISTWTSTQCVTSARLPPYGVRNSTLTSTCGQPMIQLDHKKSTPHASSAFAGKLEGSGQLVSCLASLDPTPQSCSPELLEGCFNSVRGVDLGNSCSLRDTLGLSLLRGSWAMSRGKKRGSVRNSVACCILSPGRLRRITSPIVVRRAWEVWGWGL